MRVLFRQSPISISAVHLRMLHAWEHSDICSATHIFTLLYIKHEAENFSSYYLYVTYVAVEINSPLETRRANGTATPAAPAIRSIDVTASQCFDGFHLVLLATELDDTMLGQRRCFHGIRMVSKWPCDNKLVFIPLTWSRSLKSNSESSRLNSLEISIPDRFFKPLLYISEQYLILLSIVPKHSLRWHCCGSEFRDSTSSQSLECSPIVSSFMSRM